MRLTGGLYDFNNQAGNSGQLLLTTGSGVDWVDQTSISDGDWTISGSNIYSSLSGNVGIGTTSPLYKTHNAASVGTNFGRVLHVENTSTATGQQMFGIVASQNSAAVSNAGAKIMGYAENVTGTNSGVWGSSEGSAGTGVRGWASPCQRHQLRDPRTYRKLKRICRLFHRGPELFRRERRDCNNKPYPEPACEWKYASHWEFL
ncbi:MAG: hypothetical protein MZV64_71890 [Ignavibacteriales bacterium]|nr:hypothetical protein [Ignavibacteriales bacterium]